MSNPGIHDTLTLQHLQLALVYKQMLGDADARAYLEKARVPPFLIERVACAGQQRDLQQAIDNAWAKAHCRRKAYVPAAIVEAALKIERTLGRAQAVKLLGREGIPDHVVRRVLSTGARQVRARLSLW